MAFAYLHFIQHSCTFTSALLAFSMSAGSTAAQRQTSLTTRSVPLIKQDLLNFRDLNRNGKLEPFEDWRLSPAVRPKTCSSASRLKRRQAL